MEQLKKLDRPTRLYIKRHRKSGLKYFGCCTKEFIEGYLGSGVVWTQHIINNGKDIETLWVSKWYYDESIVKFAKRFSIINDIVISNKWANCEIEDGLYTGHAKGRFLDPTVQKKANVKMVETRRKNNPCYNDQRGSKNPAWVGYHITPWGKYEIPAHAAETAPFKISSVSIGKYCRKNDTLITKSHKLLIDYYGGEIIGKTFKDLGFFIQKGLQSQENVI